MLLAVIAGGMVFWFLCGAGVMFVRKVLHGPRHYTPWTVTEWVLDVLVGVLSVVLAVVAGRWLGPDRRPRLGLDCERCGYDLRGSLAGGSNSCPECGKVIAPGQHELWGRERLAEKSGQE